MKIYLLSEGEFEDPVFKNQCIQESQEESIGFLREGSEDCLKTAKQLLRDGAHPLLVFYDAKQDGRTAYEGVFALEAEKISGIIFQRKLIRTCGAFHPFFGLEGNWEYLCRLALQTGGCELIQTAIADGEKRQEAQERREEREERAERLEERALAHAYVLRRHMKYLHRDGIMDGIFLAICEQMKKENCFLEFQKYFNLFLNDAGQYEKVASLTAPFLVMKGNDTCMGVLQKFADDLADALVKAGQAVILVGEDPNLYDELQGGIYKGIVGFQTRALEIDFFRKLSGPKFQFWMDYPLHFKGILRNLSSEYYVLCQDADHARQIREYYHTPNAIQFPPGGIAREWRETRDFERPYDIVFVGSYFKDEGKILRGFQKEFYDFVLEHPRLNFEQGLQELIGCSDEEALSEEFAEKLFDLKPACRAVIGHFREQVVAAVLKTGYSLHVYGEDWNEYKAKTPNLVIHPQVSVDESLEELQKAKVGLNIMSWHKAGMTERIANIMLSGAVCLSDETTFLREQLTDGEEMALYSLAALDEIPGILRELLEHEELRNSMARKAYERAMREFTWDERARQLTELAEHAGEK